MQNTLGELVRDGVKETDPGWKKREAKELSRIVQERLNKLQNPSSCTTAKKMYCNPLQVIVQEQS